MLKGRCFSLGTAVSTTNKTDHHDITEILLKVVLNTINQTNCWKTFDFKFIFYQNIKIMLFIEKEDLKCLTKRN
jgi:hypothetical protein